MGAGKADASASCLAATHLKALQGRCSPQAPTEAREPPHAGRDSRREGRLAPGTAGEVPTEAMKDSMKDSWRRALQGTLRMRAEGREQRSRRLLAMAPFEWSATGSVHYTVHCIGALHWCTCMVHYMVHHALHGFLFVERRWPGV